MANVRDAEVFPFSSFRPETVRGRAGFFRVARSVAGSWWLIDPFDRPLWMKAVAAVNPHGRAGPPREHPNAYARAVAGSYGEAGSSAGFAHEAARRLRSWKVNTLGPWADAEVAAEAGLYQTETADFRGAGVPVIHLHGTHLPDVFDPRWPHACEARAVQVTAGRVGRTDFVGYYTDDALGWGEPRDERPSLLQICLSLEPAFAAYHAAWEFVLAPHGGDLGALGRAWALALPSRGVVRQRTLAEEPLTTAGYLRDQDRFAREFAHRYFTTTSAALRRGDPDHLVLGCRFVQPPGKAVLAECVYPQVDVLSWQCHPTEFATQARLYAGATGMPLLLTGCGLSNERFRAVSFNARSNLTRVERMLRASRQALDAACVHPAVIGYEWGRWADERDGVAPFGCGLVHADNHEAWEHAELVERINLRAEGLRRRGR